MAILPGFRIWNLLKILIHTYICRFCLKLPIFWMAVYLLNSLYLKFTDFCHHRNMKKTMRGRFRRYSRPIINLGYKSLGIYFWKIFVALLPPYTKCTYTAGGGAWRDERALDDLVRRCYFGFSKIFTYDKIRGFAL